MISEKLLKEKSLEIVETLVERDGVSVFRVVQNGKTLLLKIHSLKTKFIHETDSLSKLYSKGLPVPAILETYRIDNNYVFLQEWWEGTTLDTVFHKLDYQLKSEIMLDVGKLIAKVHKALTPVELKQSILVKSTSNLINQFKRWKSQLKIRKSDEKQGLKHRLEKIEFSLREMEEPNILSLLHNDYCLRNIMVSKDATKIIGLIDFEHASLGDPISDLVKLVWTDLDQDENVYLEQTYLSSYENEIGTRIVRKRFNLYKAMSGLGAMAWVDKQPVSTDKNEIFREKGLHTLIYTDLI